MGLVVDVSGSMVKAINSTRAKQRSRLESLNDSLDELVRKGAELSVSGSDNRVAPLLRIFAYGFGFGGPLAFLVGGSGRPVRDLLDLGDHAETTVTIDKLADDWPTYRTHVKRIAREMLGSTPHGGSVPACRSAAYRRAPVEVLPREANDLRALRRGPDGFDPRRDR